MKSPEEESKKFRERFDYAMFLEEKSIHDAEIAEEESKCYGTNNKEV